MKSKLTASLLWLALAPCLLAQTADDYVRQGRALLAVTDLIAANRCFSNAVVRSPSHPTANVLYAATRLLTLPYQHPNGDFLTRLGLPDAGRNIYDWTAAVVIDIHGVPFVPTGVSASEFTAVLRTNILPAVVGAEANLAKVTDTNFTLALSASETRVADVTLDYGDIQLMRAGLRAAEYCAYIAYSQNVDAELTALRAMFDPNDPTTLEQGLIAYPQLFTFATTNDLNAAKLAFQYGVDRYQTASLFIRSNRPPGAVRLFNYAPEKAADEETFRRTLTELRTSLTHAVTLSIDTNYSVFLGAPFTKPEPPRSFLPWISGNGFGLATLPDPTFGGAVYGPSSLGVDQFLSRCLQPIPTIGAGFSKRGGQFELPLNLAKNRGYVVQVSTNLTVWTDCLAFFATDWGCNFSDPNIGGSSRRFYRVLDRTKNMPPPSNDDFIGRIAIPGLDAPVSGYDANATMGPRESGWTEGIGRTVWWSWTSTVSGQVVVLTPSMRFMSVFAGTTLHGLVQIAKGWGQVYFNAQPGTTYQILVDSSGWRGLEPTVRLVVTRPPTLVVTSPTNNAIYYSPADVVIAGSAWDSSGRIPGITVYGSFPHATNANNFSYLHKNVPGGYYDLYFVVTNNSGAVTQDQRSFRVRPVNDMFSNAIPIVGSPLRVTGSNRGADREGGEPCHGNDNHASIWWSWTPTNSGPVTVSCNFGDGVPPLLGVYTGSSVSALTPVTNAFWSDGMAVVQFTATASQTYKIAVDSGNGLIGWPWWWWGGVEGDVQLGINDPAVLQGGIPQLTLGVATNNLSGTFDSQTLYKVTIPSGLASLQVSISGGAGDCDLYVSHGLLPTLNDYGYAPYLDGNDETVSIPNPAAGDWYIMLHGFDSYSGVTLQAIGSGSGTNPPTSGTNGMALIPAGSFTMGDTLDGDANAIPTNVYVSAFYMDTNLVSWSQWQAVYGYATNHGYGLSVGAGKAANHPVQSVDWYDCVKWCNARSQQAGKVPVYYTDAGLTQVYTNGEVPVYVNWGAKGYRLPTEAEWEKAARGGLSGQRFPWGNLISQTNANYCGDTGSYSYDLGPNGYNSIGLVGGTPYTSPVGSLAANGYGLNDMAGNVWQWCWDWYGTPYAGGTDPRGAVSGSNRVLRGGSWFFYAFCCRAAFRYCYTPDYGDGDIGFRSVLPSGQ